MSHHGSDRPPALAAPASAPAAGAVRPKRWWILAVLGIAQLMVVLDSTVVNIALPTAQASLGFSNSDRQWVVTAYALAFGSLLLIGGRVADLLGRKRALIIGLTGFALASAAGGAAVNFAMLVTARAVQGAFGALLAPVTLALLTTTFAGSKDRGRAFGIFGGIAAGGASVGLLLGGLLTEYATWRWTLFVNVAFAVIAVAGAMTLLPRQPRSGERRLHDLWGTTSITVGLFALVFGFSNADEHGWGDAVTLACLVIAVLLLAAFVYIETRVKQPILPMRVVADRNRGGALLVTFFAGIGMFAVFLFLTYYLQENLGYSPVKSGLAFLPMTGLILLVAAGGSSILTRRISTRIVIPSGMILAAIGLVILTHISPGGNYASVVLPATLIMGAGLGLVFAPALNLAVLGVRAEDAGVASASVNAMQQVGGSVGTSLFNTLAASFAAGYVTSHLSSQHGHRLQADAALHGYVGSFWVAAAVFAGGAIISALLLRSGIPQAAPGTGDAPALA